MRALGVSSPERYPALPDIPTISESGVPGYDASTWYPLLAPAGTPRPIVDRLYRESKAAIEAAVLPVEAQATNVAPL